MNRVEILTGATSTLYAVALSAALVGTVGMAAIMPTRRRDLEPGVRLQLADRPEQGSRRPQG